MPVCSDVRLTLSKTQFRCNGEAGKMAKQGIIQPFAREAYPCRDGRPDEVPHQRGVSVNQRRRVP